MPNATSTNSKKPKCLPQVIQALSAVLQHVACNKLALRKKTATEEKKKSHPEEKEIHWI